MAYNSLLMVQGIISQLVLGGACFFRGIVGGVLAR